jgi:demethylmenaquinone methyltransferase/2-methoxy-6-polyprenyl-1,4-benzoquinol methylase
LVSQADELDAEMVEYYAARAAEYDDWYLRRGRYSHGDDADAAWRADLEAAAGWLDRLPLRGEIVDLAAGTGWWSPLLARKGRLCLYDATPEPLERARVRLAALHLSAQFVIRDAWAAPDREVDAVFAGFWLSHVPRDRLPTFLALVRRWLKPAGIFAFIDSRLDNQSGAVDHDPPSDGLQVRRLADGSTFRVRKILYSASELESVLADAGFREVRIEATDRFFLLGSARP